MTLTFGRPSGSSASRFALSEAFACTLLAGCKPQAESSWSGYAEGEYVYVAAPFAGRLVALGSQRGESVTRGAALFTLDADNERAAREEAAAHVASAKAQAANTEKGRRGDEIAVTQAQLDQARAQAALAASELARQQQLFAQGFVSDSRVDDARSAAQSAQARVDELSAALRVANLPARSDERRAALATASAAEQALQQAGWRELQTQQSAPADARVTETFFRVGEWVNAGELVLALLPPGAVKARFFVPEAELAGTAVGQPAQIQCSGCGEAIPARIDFIAAQPEYTPPVIYSNSQRSRLVFMVEARPAPAHGLRLKPGQPVDVRRASRGGILSDAALADTAQGEWAIDVRGLTKRYAGRCGIEGALFGRVVATRDRDVPGPARPDLLGDDNGRHKLPAIDGSCRTDQFVVLVSECPGNAHCRGQPLTHQRRAGTGRSRSRSITGSIDPAATLRRTVASMTSRFAR